MSASLQDLATAVMEDYDEETTGSQALDILLNACMVHDCHAAALELAEALRDVLRDVRGCADPECAVCLQRKATESRARAALERFEK